MQEISESLRMEASSNQDDESLLGDGWFTNEDDVLVVVDSRISVDHDAPLVCFDVIGGRWIPVSTGVSHLCFCLYL